MAISLDGGDAALVAWSWQWWHEGCGFCGMGFCWIVGWSDGCGAVVEWSRAMVAYGLWVVGWGSTSTARGVWLERGRENELKGKRYFGGETIGLLDIAANMIGYWLGVFEEASGASELLTREKFPKLFNWANEFVSVSATKESLPPRDKDVAFMRKRFGMVNTSK